MNVVIDGDALGIVGEHGLVPPAQSQSLVTAAPPVHGWPGRMLVCTDAGVNGRPPTRHGAGTKFRQFYTQFYDEPVTLISRTVLQDVAMVDPRPLPGARPPAAIESRGGRKEIAMPTMSGDPGAATGRWGACARGPGRPGAGSFLLGRCRAAARAGRAELPGARGSRGPGEAAGRRRTPPIAAAVFFAFLTSDDGRPLISGCDLRESTGRVVRRAGKATMRRAA